MAENGIKSCASDFKKCKDVKKDDKDAKVCIPLADCVTKALDVSYFFFYKNAV